MKRPLLVIILDLLKSPGKGLIKKNFKFLTDFIGLKKIKLI